MKTCKWSARGALRASVLGMAIAAGGPVMAADSTYNIVLKDTAGTALSCATGGFTFGKTAAGSFPTTGASVLLTGCTFVPAIANGTYTPGDLNVEVENVTLTKPGTGGNDEPLNQGPNVEGLTGTLQFSTNAAGDCDGTGSSTDNKTYTITFSYTSGSQNSAGRTYMLTCVGPGSFTARTGSYHVLNTANLVPEPDSLPLALVGLSALALSWHLRRRKS